MVRYSCHCKFCATKLFYACFLSGSDKTVNQDSFFYYLSIMVDNKTRFYPCKFKKTMKKYATLKTTETSLSVSWWVLLPTAQSILGSVKVENEPFVSRLSNFLYFFELLLRSTYWASINTAKILWSVTTYNKLTDSFIDFRTDRSKLKSEFIIAISVFTYTVAIDPFIKVTALPFCLKRGMQITLLSCFSLVIKG